MPKTIEISHRTIIFTVLFLVFLLFLFQIRYILLIFFIGMIISAALNPLVEKLGRWRIPRVLAVVVIYVLIFVFLGLVLAGVIPPLISQTSTFITRFPDYSRSLGFWSIDENMVNVQIDQFLSRLGAISVDIFKLTLGVFGNFINLFTVIFVSFYMLLEHKNLDKYLLRLFGSANNRKVEEIINKVERRMGEWVRAEVTLMLIVGIMSYVGLRLLGIDFALPLALLAGLLEIVPNIGPLLSSVPAILAGLAISPLMGLAVVALYFLVQQIENHFIVPQVMAKETGVNPLVTIFALMAGFKIGGMPTAVLSIPIVLLIEVLATEFLSSK